MRTEAESTGTGGAGTDGPESEVARAVRDEESVEGESPAGESPAADEEEDLEGRDDVHHAAAAAAEDVHHAAVHHAAAAAAEDEDVDDVDEQGDGSEPKTLGTRSEIEDLEGCKRRLKAAIPWDKVAEELERSYKELANVVQIPGFRRGRVPRRLLEARFGEELESEVKDGLVNTSFAEVVEERELQVIGTPRFDGIQFQRDADLQYEAEFEVRPAFELAAYKDVEVTHEPRPVRDEDIDAEVTLLRRRVAKPVGIEPQEGAAEDYYRGVYNLFREGMKVKAMQPARFQPQSKVLDVFQVADLPERVAAWDRSTQNPLQLGVKAPSYYADEPLRGAELKLEFLLQDVVRLQLPEVNDEFARGLGKESLADLKSEVREALTLRHRREEEKRLEEKILDKIAAATPMELPEGLLQTQAERLRLEREYELLERGLLPEEVQEKLAAEGERMAEELRREVKWAFILSEISQREKIFVTEKELDERLALLSHFYRMPAAKLREELRSKGRLAEIRFNLLNEKTRAFLRARARVVDAEGRPVESAGPVSEKGGVGGAGGTAPAPDPITEAPEGT